MDVREQLRCNPKLLEVEFWTPFMVGIFSDSMESIGAPQCVRLP